MQQRAEDYEVFRSLLMFYFVADLLPRDDYKLRIKHLKECLGTMKTQFDCFNRKNNKKVLLGKGYRDVEGGGNFSHTFRAYLITLIHLLM